MATFKFGRTVDIHWNGYDIQGPADTVFSIPDQLYEEFDADIAPVEPTLVWLDTNEFLTLQNNVSVSTLSATFPIALATSTSGKTISLSSSTNPNGYLLAADGSGGIIFTPASTSGLTSVVGASPISSTIAGGTATVSIDQAAITGATAATNAQVVRFYVKNTTGTTIPKRSAVYVSGATGDNALISLASATSDPSSSKTLGITAEAIANDAFGYVIEAGYLTDIDTSATTAGAAVWLGNTPGSLVFVSPPAEPSHAVYLGVVVRVQSMNGSILVKVQNGYELDELHDVSAANPTDLDILQYKNSSSLWTKSSIAGAGIAASSHTHNYQASGTYVNAVIGTSPASVSTASGTATVSISSGTATSGQVLTANGSGGVSFANASGGVTGPVSSIDNSLPRFDGTGGATIQGSSVIVNDSNDVFFPATIAHSPVSVSISSNTYTLDLSAGNYFTGITAGARIVPEFVTSTSIDFGAATSGTLTIPSGLQVNDYLIGVIGSDGGSAVAWGSTSPSGWTKIAALAGGTGFAYGFIFVSTITVANQTTINGGPFTGLLTASTGAVYVLRGAATYEAIATSTGTVGMPTAPALNNVDPNSVVLAIGFLDDDNVTATAPTGYSNIVTQSSSVAGFTTMIAMTNTTATGTQNMPAVTFGGTGTDDWASATIAFFGRRSDRHVVLSSPPDQAISGFLNAKAHTIVINCASSTSGLLNWDSKIVWAANGTPSITTRSLVVLTSYDGVTYYGNYSNFY